MPPTPEELRKIKVAKKRQEFETYEAKILEPRAPTEAERKAIAEAPPEARPDPLVEEERKVELSADDLRRVREILPDGSFGGRYRAGMMPEWE